MTTSIRTSLAALSTLAILAGCNATGDVTSDTEADVEVSGDIDSGAELEGYLADKNHFVSESGRDSIAIPTGDASSILRTDGGIIYLYEFEDSDNAEEARSQMSTNTTMQSETTWEGPPHFFGNDAVIAVYVGSDATVLASLKEVFGEQFAGAEIDAAMDATSSAAATSVGAMEGDDAMMEDDGAAASVSIDGTVDVGL